MADHAGALGPLRTELPIYQHNWRLPLSFLPAGESDALTSELNDTKASLAELQGERDELAGQLATAEAEAANTADCLEQAK